MPNKVSLKLIIDEMDSQLDIMSIFYNKDTREINFVSEDEFRMEEDEVNIEDLPGWL